MTDPSMVDGIYLLLTAHKGHNEKLDSLHVPAIKSIG